MTTTRHTAVERDPVERDPVEALYDEWADFQERRLDWMPCELHIHRETLIAHLEPTSRVLDVGAGPGRYAVELLRLGHRLVVGDLSPVLVDAASRVLGDAGFQPGDGQLDDVLRLDARDLGAFDDASFDAVIAFGPFYHLQDADERRRAMAEVSRVVRPGGLIFATFMPRHYWASLALHNVIARGESDDPAADTHVDRLDGLLSDGLFKGVKSPQLRHGWFCKVDEIAPAFATVGVEHVALLASSSLAGPWSDPDVWRRFAERPEAIRRRLLDLLLRHAADPHALAFSDQVLFVGRKRRPIDEDSP